MAAGQHASRLVTRRIGARLMAHFVLVAGAWHGAWCWEYVIPLLEARGHAAQAAELPGMGSDRTSFAELGLMDWARSVSRVVEEAPGPVILVGHSRGGVVVSQVAELVPDRIGLSVYLTAILPGHGETGLDVSSLVPPDSLQQREYTLTDDDLAFVADPALLSRSYARATPELVERAMARVTPEPRFGILSPVSLSAGRYGRVKRAYIECLADPTVPLALQRAMQAREPCDPVRTIDTDHCPTFSAPELVAKTLDDLAGYANYRQPDIN